MSFLEKDFFEPELLKTYSYSDSSHTLHYHDQIFNIWEFQQKNEEKTM